jgi:hypothetical protein
MMKLLFDTAMWRSSNGSMIMAALYMSGQVQKLQAMDIWRRHCSAWLCENGCPLTEHMCTDVVGNGHLDILQWARYY